MKKKVFIAAPMSSFDNELYAKSRSNIIESIELIEKRFQNVNVFYAGNKLTEQSNFQDPFESIISDLNELDRSSIFILIYMESIASSALIETGYALKAGKSMGIFTNERSTLPFLIRSIDAVYPNVKVFEIKAELSESLVDFIEKVQNS